jgi:hypothetical protein
MNNSHIGCFAFFSQRVCIFPIISYESSNNKQLLESVLNMRKCNSYTVRFKMIVIENSEKNGNFSYSPNSSLSQYYAAVIFLISVKCTE